MRALIILLVLLTTVLAQAQEPVCGPHEGIDDPVKIFEQGAACFRQGKFAEALVRFERAHAIDPDPTLLYNIARSHEGLDNDEEAIAAYRRDLEARPEAPDRGAVEKRIAQLERPPPPPPRPPSVTPEPRGPQIAPWIIAGVGAVTLAVGGVLGGASLSGEGDAEAEQDAFTAADLRDDAATLATAANVTMVVGGAVLLAGVIWGSVDLATIGDTEVSIGPNGIWARGSF